MYKLFYTKQAKKYARKQKESNLRKKALEILKILEEDSFADYPPYEKLIGDLTGAFSEESIFSIELFIRSVKRNKL